MASIAAVSPRASPLGAYAFVAGVDLYAHTGFIKQTNSFINSKANIDNRVGTVSGEQIALLVTFIVLALLGMAVQFRMWGRRNFRPARGNAVYTEKPFRFGGYFRRRY